MRRHGGITVSTAGSVAGPSGPPSPTMSAHTTATNIGIAANRLPPYLINRADLRNSLSTYDTLLAAAKTYTQALLALGSASSDLAVALESCSRLKGAHDVGGGLLAASGIHHMAGNAFSILADSFWKEASIPLLEHHDLYVQACADRTVQHERTIQAKSKALQEAEKRNQKMARGKAGRDLHSFRQALNELQRHVDELDEEKARYYTEVLEGEEECWTFVQSKVMGALRCQIDTHERIASKGLSDPLLEPILAGIPDPFSAYGPPSSDDKIFSILSQGVLQSYSDQDRSFSSEAPTPNEAGGPPLQKPSNLILSPGTPSKGLSRVTSGAASPQLAQADGKPLEGAASPAIIHGVGKHNKGLGVSLTAAAELARQQGSKSPSDAPAGKPTASLAGRRGELTDASAAELFGTDGEDDGGDEASIFSGTEDDEGRGPLSIATGTGDEGIYSSDGVNSRQPGMAARIIAEKKKRRDQAVRANAKTRLRNALSTIDESKSPAAAGRTNSNSRTGDRSGETSPVNGERVERKHGSHGRSASADSSRGTANSVKSSTHSANATASRDSNFDHASDVTQSHDDDEANNTRPSFKRDGSDTSQATAVPPSERAQDAEAHSVWH